MSGFRFGQRLYDIDCDGFEWASSGEQLQSVKVVS